ncbi:MAG: glutathione synthase [Hyphomicrobiaceae bacterium]|nr:glutathione synthase [Hyphomicrobiaceae bacterium]
MSPSSIRPLRVACQMDPIDRIDIRGDSTFALLLEAQARGHALFYYLPQALTLDGDVLRARGETLDVRDEVGAHYRVSDARVEDLSAFDVVLLRQDPPFDMAYITSTHLLERIHPQTLVVNDPREVRNAPEKLWVLDFQDLMPPTMVTRSAADVQAFRERHGDIIVKPLYGNGGASVFRIQPGDTNLGSLVELFQSIFREPFMVQEYRPEVRLGDKRIILVDGELAGVINRVPAAGETRSNLHVGGTASAVALTDRDREICRRLGPELKRRGLIFTGIDVIGPYLTEINVTSPTGIRHIKDHGGPDIAAMIWDAIQWKIGEGRVMAGHG